MTLTTLPLNRFIFHRYVHRKENLQHLCVMQLMSQKYTHPAVIHHHHFSPHNNVFTSVTHVCSRYLQILFLFTGIFKICHMSEKYYIIPQNHGNVPYLTIICFLRQNTPSIYSPSLSLYNSSSDPFEIIFQQRDIHSITVSTRNLSSKASEVVAMGWDGIFENVKRNMVNGGPLISIQNVLDHFVHYLMMIHFYDHYKHTVHWTSVY